MNRYLFLKTISAIVLFMWIIPPGLLAQNNQIKKLPDHYHTCGLRATKKNIHTRIAPPQQLFKPSASSAQFEVSFHDGFITNPAAKAAFEYAIKIWDSLLRSSATIRVYAALVDTLLPEVLAQAGPQFIFSGNRNGKTVWYPIALAKALGLANHSNYPIDRDDIIAVFNDRQNWYFGTDSLPTPNGKLDFASVVLHELGHGLGFLGTMEVKGNQGSWGRSPDKPAKRIWPFTYDLFAINQLGEQLINIRLFPNPSSQLRDQLTSNNIRFSGQAAKTANDTIFPQLHAPPNWQSGSSYSHLDENTYPSGNINSLMTPVIGQAEQRHDPGPIALGVLKDIGWHLSSDPIPIPASGISAPNPFTSTTEIKYNIPQSAMVTLKIFNPRGQLVKTLLKEYQNKKDNPQTIPWNATDHSGQPVSSGMYFYQIISKDQVIGGKMIFINSKRP